MSHLVLFGGTFDPAPDRQLLWCSRPRTQRTHGNLIVFASIRHAGYHNDDMFELVEQHREQIAALCRRHGVKRLELIGSASRGDFDSGRSDLDFLVEFIDQHWEGSAKRYFGLLFGLEDLFQRRIDLVDRIAASKGFLAVAEQNRDMLYVA